MIAVWAFRIVEIVNGLADGTCFLRKGIFFRHILGCEKFELAAFGTVENVRFKCSGDKVGQITENPAGFPEL